MMASTVLAGEARAGTVSGLGAAPGARRAADHRGFAAMGDSPGVRAVVDLWSILRPGWATRWPASGLPARRPRGARTD
ncbi:hypothetical protein [Sorangium sp. So ce1000]|uniref:hypothetical protein n=1 Tax=Sorangium sp. So ce1000 TaxID=3133325 RepID=UPI003F5E026E